VSVTLAPTATDCATGWAVIAGALLVEVTVSGGAAGHAAGAVADHDIVAAGVAAAVVDEIAVGGRASRR
jgi:hypothetical protein